MTAILRHPTQRYIRRVVDAWGDVFSVEELLRFQGASGRRRCRKKLQKAMRPFLIELAKSAECAYARQHFKDMLGEVPRKVVTVYDIAQKEERLDKEFTEAKASELFPLDKTFDPRLVRPVMSEVGTAEYAETMLGLLWEASCHWDTLRNINWARGRSFGALVGIEPDEEPSVQKVIDKSLDFALRNVDANKVIDLVRWVMARLLVLHFLELPYSNKTKVSLDTPVGDDLTLGDTLADRRAEEEFSRREDLLALESSLEELSAAQREASELFLEADLRGVSPEKLSEERGKKFKTVQRNFERALKTVESRRDKLG